MSVTGNERMKTESGIDYVDETLQTTLEGVVPLMDPTEMDHHAPSYLVALEACPSHQMALVHDLPDEGMVNQGMEGACPQAAPLDLAQVDHVGGVEGKPLAPGVAEGVGEVWGVNHFRLGVVNYQTWQLPLLLRPSSGPEELQESQGEGTQMVAEGEYL